MNAVRFGQQNIYPSKVVCVGRNYAEHIKELDNAIPDQMVVFNKPNSSITSTLHSYHQETLHYETEICFMVKDGQSIVQLDWGSILLNVGNSQS